MAVTVSYPGVYIDEFTPGAPIQGVGTSTAAFVGVAARGRLDEPVKLTSWDQFVQRYGPHPVPGFQLWYAVRGFFQNGGQTCYVVRASNGSYGTRDLANRDAVDTYRVRARQPGNQAISIAIADQHLLDSANTALFMPVGDLAAANSGREFTLSAAAPQSDAEVAGQFRPGDVVTVGNQGERLRVVNVAGAVVRVETEPQFAYAATDVLRLADAPTGTRTLRVSHGLALVPGGSLQRGTVLTVSQGAPQADVVDTVAIENLPGGDITYRVTLRQGLSSALNLDPATAPATTVQSEELTIAVTMGSTTSYANLGVDATHPRYFRTAINDDPAALVTLEPIEPRPAGSLPDTLLADTGGAVALTPGTQENLATLVAADFVEAIEALREVDDVNLVACPETLSNAGQQTIIQLALIGHCEAMADRFAVLDARPSLEPFGAAGVETQRQALTSPRGYAALYYPWLRVPPAHAGDPVLVPPSGHLCGIISRSDLSRGVHKAPANELIRGAVGLERNLSDVDQGQLNLQGINVLRRFAGGPPTVWGARTTAADTNWQYVNVRRLFLFLEESIQDGIRWAVFEPNNPSLWKKLRRTIVEFLTRVWRDGALFGETAADAFYVRIDEQLNPFSEQALGRLHIEVGVRPAYPAEFIIVRIGIWPGGAEIEEQ